MNFAIGSENNCFFFNQITTWDDQSSGVERSFVGFCVRNRRTQAQHGNLPPGPPSRKSRDSPRRQIAGQTGERGPAASPKRTAV